MKKKDIPFETLRKIYTKFIIGVVVFILIMSVLILKSSRANFQVKQSVPFVKGTINYIMPDIQISEIYVDDVRVTSLEENQNYVLDTTKSYCTYKDEKLDNITISYNSNTKEFNVTPVENKGTKCYVYFNTLGAIAKEIILANKTVSTRSDFSAVLTTDTTGIIYKAQDDDGTTYYFAGAPTDNYVYFAGFYWRIIRVNGDGSIRLIYDGTSAIANGTSSADTQINTSAFNSSYDDNAYVGFMYTSRSVQGLGTSSTIKGVLDTWYTSNLADYASYIDTNAGFCGDRQPFANASGTTEGGGTGTTTTYYAAYIRLITNKTPSYKCTYSEDLYTINLSSKGNRALTNPIGLITTDEVAYAGGVYGTKNTSFYLYTGRIYWTLSPSVYSNIGAHSFYVSAYGRFQSPDSTDGVENSYGVRPVINLRSDVTLTGDGTSSNPYRVE